MLKIYHNPRCSKSRQTLQLINDAKIAVEIVDYLNDVPNKEELNEILTKLGLEASQIIRKGEPTYKENFKGKHLTNDEWIDAMIEFPKLIERPIVVKGAVAVLGRPPENVNKLL